MRVSLFSKILNVDPSLFPDQHILSFTDSHLFLKKTLYELKISQPMFHMLILYKI